MATIKAQIRKNIVNKQGLTNVQIAICHKQKTAYIPTDIKVRPEDFVGGIIVRGSNKNNLNAQIMSMISDYGERLKEIEHIEAKNVTQIKDYLSQIRVQSFKMISEGYDLYISTLTKENSIKSYRTSQKAFNEFCKGNDVPIAALDTSFVIKYEKWLRSYCPFRTQRYQMYGTYGKLFNNKPMKTCYAESSIATNMAHLKAVINKCINEGWVSYKVHPFSKTEIHRSPTRENIPTAFDMQKIKGYHGTNSAYQECADIFMLTFYLGGANMADIIQFDFRQDTITYEREKVKSRTRGSAMVTIPIIDDARVIADKYMGEDGKLKLRYTTSNYNYRIKAVADELGISSYLTFTSARKAVAQIACDLGFNDNYVNYILGHSMSKARRMLDPYSKVQSKLAGEILKTLAKIIDTPEKIEEKFMENIKKLLEI